MLLGISGASMLRNMLTGKGVRTAGCGYNNMDHMDKNFTNVEVIIFWLNV